ncbi:major capsid protein [Capybara microvirus Cap1_SP_209]|nr:major capsid protein [Capybara microvirus Cap1_SP_209]
MSKNSAKPSFGRGGDRFAHIPSVQIQRSTFDRSHRYLTTLDSGKLIPFFVDEALPGDTFNLSANLLARMTTPITPFMDNIYLETFWFFVPNRLIWKHWEALNGDRSSGPNASVDYLVPQSSIVNLEAQTIGDYMGLPTRVPNSIPVSDLPLRAYSLIYNEWFRNENLQDSVNVDPDTGRVWVGDSGIHTESTITNKVTYSDTPLYRNKRHDYFTSALPWTQKGASQGVTISLGSSLPITTTVTVPQQTVQFSANTPTFKVGNNDVGQLSSQGYVYISDESRVNNLAHFSSSSNRTGNVQWNNPGLYVPAFTLSPTGTASLEAATAITINDLRQAFQIQKLLERDARGGTRYTEILRSHFGVLSPDSRLQRPEFLGSSSSRINVLSVAQTSATSSTTPQGNLAAYAVGGEKFHGFAKSFVEHGFIIGLVNIRSDITYQQGLNRMWSRKGRFDFYWPVLAHLGEQPVYQKEIYAQGLSSEDDKVFGYQERYAEYRYKPSQITGKTRSTDPQSLDIWHLAEKFDNAPALNSSFIQDTSSPQGIQRALAVQNEPQFILDCWFNLKTTRPMPVYSVPGLVDHF